MARTSIAVCVVGLLVVSGRLLAACPEVVGVWPYGPANVVAVAGDLAYLGSGSGLLIVDLRDESAPRVIGGLALPGIAKAIRVSDRHAYVAAGSAGLRVIDVHAPSAPAEVGFLELPNGADDVVLSRGHAYVTSSDGLRVVTVLTPSQPRLAAFVATPRPALGVAVYRRHVYVTEGDVTTGDGTLRVIDVRTPSEPVEGAVVDLPGIAGDLAVAADYAYLVEADRSSGEEGLRVIDVTTPTAPRDVGFIGIGGASEIVVSGSFANVVSRICGCFGCSGILDVIDLSVPSAPRYAGSAFFDASHTWSISADGARDRAYIAGSNVGLLVFDVSIPSAPVEVSRFIPPGSTLGVAVAGDLAYIVGGGFRVVDLHALAAPAQGLADPPVDGVDVAVSGRHAYVAGGAGLRVVDVSDPATPVEVGSYATPIYGREAEFVAVEDGHAFLAYTYLGFGDSAEGGLHVLDVATPSAPMEVGRIDVPGRPHVVAVADGYAYVTYWSSYGESGMRVFDVATPAAPVEVGHLDLTWTWGVAVDGSYAYVTCSEYSVASHGLCVIDVSTPSAPVKVGFVHAPFTYAVATAGGYAYLRYQNYDDDTGGVRVIDVSTPSAPVEVGAYEVPFTRGSGGGDVVVSDGQVFVTAGDAGLLVVDDCQPWTTPEVPRVTPAWLLHDD